MHSLVHPSQAACREAYIYARQRQAFGKSIAQYQATMLRLANIKIESDVAVLTLLDLANCLDNDPVFRPRSNPMSEGPQVALYRGNLCPDGAWVKEGPYMRETAEYTVERFETQKEFFEGTRRGAGFETGKVYLITGDKSTIELLINDKSVQTFTNTNCDWLQFSWPFTAEGRTKVELRGFETDNEDGPNIDDVELRPKDQYIFEYTFRPDSECMLCNSPSTTSQNCDATTEATVKCYGYFKHDQVMQNFCWTPNSKHPN